MQEPWLLFSQPVPCPLVRQHIPAFCMGWKRCESLAASTVGEARCSLILSRFTLWEKSESRKISLGPMLCREWIMWVKWNCFSTFSERPTSHCFALTVPRTSPLTSGFPQGFLICQWLSKLMIFGGNLVENSLSAMMMSLQSKCFILIKWNMLILSFVSYAFGVMSKKYLTNLSLKRFPPIFSPRHAIYIFILLKYIWFTVLYWFLLYSKVTQLYIYIHRYINIFFSIMIFRRVLNIVYSF